MRLRRPALFTLLALFAAASVATAGTVNVRFVNSSRYADAGNTGWEEQANLQTLDRHLKAIGKRWLPANHVLNVDVWDVDLAGAVRPFHGAPEIRVLNGGADFPRIHLQYTLEVDGKETRRGDEWLTDLNYTRRITGQRDSGSLHYERRMIDDWFKARFLGTAGSSPG